MTTPPLRPYEPPETTPRAAPSRVRRIVVWVLSILILIPSMWGFGSKFYEFIQLASGKADGIFAITPVINYLLASLGFFCLLVWATMHGMFHDIEKPKYTMLDNEARIEAANRHGRRRHFGV